MDSPEHESLIDTMSVPIPGPTDDLAIRFRELAGRWKAESSFSSSSRRLAQHPAYREIVAMGGQAVPLLLAELARSPDLWFLALSEITGEDPIPAEARGRLKEMAEAWLAWGRRHGYAC